jgi:hypothetical protein
MLDPPLIGCSHLSYLNVLLCCCSALSQACFKYPPHSVPHSYNCTTCVISTCLTLHTFVSPLACFCNAILSCVWCPCCVTGALQVPAALGAATYAVRNIVKCRPHHWSTTGVPAAAFFPPHLPISYKHFNPTPCSLPLSMSHCSAVFCYGVVLQARFKYPLN